MFVCRKDSATRYQVKYCFAVSWRVVCFSATTGVGWLFFLEHLSLFTVYSGLIISLSVTCQASLTCMKGDVWIKFDWLNEVKHNLGSLCVHRTALSVNELLQCLFITALFTRASFQDFTVFTHQSLILLKYCRALLFMCKQSLITEVDPFWVTSECQISFNIYGNFCFSCSWSDAKDWKHKDFHGVLAYSYKSSWHVRIHLT